MTEGVRRAAVDAAGRRAHRARWPLALVHLRGRLRHCHSRGRARGHARRGDPRAGLRRGVRRLRARPAGGVSVRERELLRPWPWRWRPCSGYPDWPPSTAPSDPALGLAFAASGSFLPAIGLFSLVPYLFGGYGHLGERKYFSHYNLPDVGLYLGILPIVALLSLWHPRWPSGWRPATASPGTSSAAFGLRLVFGAATPLEHLFASIPLYGHQRLQSRNMIDFSVAVTVLFAGWLDRRDGLVPVRCGVSTARWRPCSRSCRRCARDRGPAVPNAGFSLPSATTHNPTVPGQVHTVREATLDRPSASVSPLWLHRVAQTETLRLADGSGLFSVFMVARCRSAGGHRPTGRLSRQTST